MFRISCLVFVLGMAIGTNGEEAMKRLLLTVYYESKCPDSKSFVLKELVPTMELLEDYVDLDLVPFGKSHSTNGSSVTFHCQHGPKECAGNMVQGCTIDMMFGRASDLRIAKYVACEMETEAGTRFDTTCSRRAGVNERMVSQCASNSRGIELQLKYEQLTKKIKPRFIPTVTVNNKFNQKTQDMAMKDLALTLCKFLRHEHPCTRRFNSYDFGVDYDQE